MFFETDDTAGPSFAVDWFKAAALAVLFAASSVIAGAVVFWVWNLF